MLPLLLGLYVAVAATLAYIGRDTRIGPVLIFLVSIFITPIFPAIYVLVARLERKDERVAGG
jgi:predicted MFS family arabinose efflux permease